MIVAVTLFVLKMAPWPMAARSEQRNGLTSSCSLGTETNDVWYRYTSTVSEAVTLSLCGSLLADSTLALFDNCGGNELACNDDFWRLRSEITFPLSANTTYSSDSPVSTPKEPSVR